jgi:hypothetical protein
MAQAKRMPKFHLFRTILMQRKNERGRRKKEVDFRLKRGRLSSVRTKNFMRNTAKKPPPPDDLAIFVMSSSVEQLDMLRLL